MERQHMDTFSHTNIESPIGRIDTHRATDCGELRGFVDPLGCCVWLGVPYAEPPLGPLRWCAPQPAQPWHGVRDALQVSPCGYQPAPFGATQTDAIVGSEDCLYLNIWAPAPASDAEQLPVMVWIHGGSNSKGHGGSFDGGVLATTQRVIVVTVNYRLGVFGWFHHPALHSAQAPASDRSGNYALLDLMAALQWIKNNIGVFGGNAHKITVFGESSGGLNIFGLLTSPLAVDLFQRAIIQSGVTLTVSVEQATQYRDADTPGLPKSSSEVLIQLLINDHLAVDRAAAKQWIAAAPPHEINTYLRSKNFAEFEHAYRVITESIAPNPAVLPMLICDGSVLPSDGINGALQREQGCHPVPILLGCTRDEYTILLPLIGASREWVQPLKEGFGFRIRDRAKYNLLCEYLSRFVQAEAVAAPAQHLTHHAQQEVFAYRFDWDRLLPTPWLDGVKLGATHGLDVPFVFGHLQLGPEFVQIPLISSEQLLSFKTLSAAMMSYWAQFADTGNPACGREGTLPRWLPYQLSQPQSVMLLDALEGGGLRMSDDIANSHDLYEVLLTDARLVDAKSRCNFISELMRLRIALRFESGE
jgi:para-nitrobenzyl esterase